jgi:hypothetical protein
MKKHNLLVVVPGYGDTGCDNIEHKKQILDKNLDYFLNENNGLVMIKQFNRPDFLYHNSRHEIRLFYKNISLSEFLYEYITPELVKDYDYIIVILDDVEIKDNLKIDHIIEVYEKSKLDILSPSVEGASWTFMSQKKGSKPREVRVVNGGVELFCYLMRPQSYEAYYERVLVPWNDFMWGCDLVLEYADLKTGIYDFWTSKHYYRGSPKDMESKKQSMLKYLRCFFKNSIPDVFGRWGTLRKIIKV